VFACTLPPWCVANADHVIKGKVVDEKTQQPISGAIVVAEWHGTREPILHEPRIGGAHSCFHVALSYTNNDGTFRITSPFLKAHIPRMLPNRYNELVIYKDGYKILHANNHVRGATGNTGYKYKTHALKRSANHGDERLFELNSIHHAIEYKYGDADGSQASYVPLLEAISLEAERNISRYYQTYFLKKLEYNIDILKNRAKREAINEPKRIRNPAGGALASGEPVALQYLIETGMTNPDDRLANGDTLLMKAAAMGHADMVAYLLATGANPTRIDHLGDTAMQKVVNSIQSSYVKDPSGHIEIIKMLLAMDGVDTQPLTVLRSNRNMEIKALAAINAGSSDNIGGSSEVAELLNLFQGVIELTGNQHRYFQFIIIDGKIQGIQEVPELPSTGEVLSLHVRETRNPGRRNVGISTRMRGQLYMRVILEGGNEFALPAQKLLIGKPPYNNHHVYIIEPDWKRATVTDFYLHNWPEEQPELRNIDFSYGGNRAVIPKTSGE
jgi:hypothetical protein